MRYLGISIIVFVSIVGILQFVGATIEFFIDIIEQYKQYKKESNEQRMERKSK